MEFMAVSTVAMSIGFIIAGIAVRKEYSSAHWLFTGPGILMLVTSLFFPEVLSKMM